MCETVSMRDRDANDLWIVSRETSERLALFEALLLKWNSRINLVGRNETSQLRRRHVDDSLQLLSLLPANGPVVDLGSGGGFPGLVIAIASGRSVTLVEADARKATFLREAARATGAPVEVINDRIEHCGIQNAGIVTARALAPLERLLRLSYPLLSSAGVSFLPKGGNIDAELTAAETGWQMSLKRHPSQTAPDGCILEVRHLQPISAAPSR